MTLNSTYGRLPLAGHNAEDDCLQQITFDFEYETST